MSTTQHTSSPPPEGTRTSGAGPPTPPPREEDGTPSRKPNHLSFYCALAGGVLFVIAVLSAGTSGGTGRFGLPAAIVAFVLFIVAVYRNMPGAGRQMPSDHAPGGPADAPHRSDAARREAEGEHLSADADFFRDFLERRPQR